MRAIVERVKNDGKAFKATDGEWYSTRDDSCAVLQVGQEVEFDNVKNGRWNNIKDGKIMVVSGSAAPATSGGGAAPPKLPWNAYQDMTYQLNVQKHIGRQNALTNAVNGLPTWAPDTMILDRYASEVFALAEAFSTWTAGGSIGDALDALDPQAPAADPQQTPNPKTDSEPTDSF